MTTYADGYRDALEAAANAAFNVGRKRSMPTMGEVMDAIRALPVPDAAPAPLRIKPLVWRGNFADDPFGGRYFVIGSQWHHVPTGACGHSGEDAAQAHHDACIRAAIVGDEE